MDYVEILEGVGGELVIMLQASLYNSIFFGNQLVEFHTPYTLILEEEPSTMEVPQLTQAAAEVQQPAPTDSLDSFDSINVPTNQNPRPQVVAPETFNIASPTADGQVHPEEVIEPETEDRKSISSNLQ